MTECWLKPPPLPQGGGIAPRVGWRGKDMTDHKCMGVPKSSDFRDGSAAEGCWVEGDLHYQQVAGSSGVYLVVTNVTTGEVMRDDRPWQMKN